MDFKPEPLDARIFCRRIVDELLSATNRVCPIELSLAGDLASMTADERLLRHILTNLLSNAVKYSPTGSTVNLSAEQDGRYLVCRVRDRGIGIPDPDKEWLFNAFHRGRNVAQRPGTGLGLVIVKRCVELHRGSIRLESKVGEGTTIIVRLPVFPS